MSSRRLFRALLSTLSLLAFGIPEAVSSPPHSVAVLKSRDLAPYNLAVQGIRRALLGWDPTVRIRVFDLPAGAVEERNLLESLQRSRPDLIITIGTQATRAVSSRVRDIPVVFSLVLASGGQDSLIRRRAPNVTGAAMDVPIEEQFHRLRQVIPNLNRVGVIFNPRETGGVVQAARRAAVEAGLVLVEIPVSNEAQVLKEVAGLKVRVDALWAVADSTVFTPRSVDFILLSTLRDGIPFVGLSPSFVKAGALLSFSCDYLDVGAQSGEVAVEVLKGRSPADLPILYPRQVSLFLNLNTARAIHLEIPENVRAESQVYPEP